MKKIASVSFICAVLFCFGLSPVYAMDPPSSPLKLAYFPKKVVMFPHSAHKLECKTCHHKPEGEIKKCSTAGCHDVFDKKDKSEKSFYKIAHDKKTKTTQSCLKCHKKEAGKDKAKKKELTGCKGSKCHP